MEGTSMSGGRISVVTLICACNALGLAQGPEAPDFGEAIEDNSFFIEEAFNQEPGVVQHIATFTMFPSPQRDVVNSFTQEWPIGSQRHQLSYTVSYLSLEQGRFAGIGDLLLNYRYQVADADWWGALAPRLSIIFPTGNAQKGLGNGVVGFQCNIPLSKRVSDHWIMHANAGVTVHPNAEGTTASGSRVKRTLSSYNLGGSVLLLASSTTNVLLEASLSNLGTFEEGIVVRSVETVVSPGVRMAIDSGELQIVPGLGVPWRFADGRVHVGIFLYLSFEHPF